MTVATALGHLDDSDIAAGCSALPVRVPAVPRARD
jgi:hypothetical protein